MSLDAFALFAVSTALAADSDRDNALDGIDTVHLKSGVFGWTQLAPSAAFLWRLDREDNTTPASATVVVPLTGPGRWKVFAEGGVAGPRKGYAQNTKTQNIFDTNGFIPGDADPNPLEVSMTGLVPGDYVEVAFDAEIINLNGAEALEISIQALVTFISPPPPLGVGWFIINACRSEEDIPADELEPLDAFALFQVPVDATVATVRLEYVASGVDLQFQVPGNDNTGVGPTPPTLKAEILAADSVFQPGSFTLVPR